MVSATMRSDRRGDFQVPYGLLLVWVTVFPPQREFYLIHLLQSGRIGIS